MTIALVVVVAADTLRPLTRKPGDPATLEQEGLYVIALDKEGKEVWRYELQNIPARVERRGGPYTAYDQDSDGSSEFLFWYRPLHDWQRDELLCLSSHGKLLWSFTVGKSVADAERQYSEGYHLRAFTSIPSPESSGKKRWVVVASVHGWGEVANVSLLDEHGPPAGVLAFRPLNRPSGARSRRRRIR